MTRLFRYDLNVEIPATEVAVVVDALDGEKLSLCDRLGKDELHRQLEEHELDVHVRGDQAWPDFRHNVEILSIYLSEPISGKEIHVDESPEGPIVEGWMILGRRGETARLALDVGWDASKEAPIDRGIDRGDARRRWKDLPEWVRSTVTARVG